MEARLRLETTVGVIGSASDSAYTWGLDAGLGETAAVELALATDGVVTDIVLHAVTGAEGELEITFHADPEVVEVVVRGPGDPDRHPGELRETGIERVRHLVDDLVCVKTGRAGKEFRLVKRIPSEHVASRLFAAADAAEPDDAPPETSYALAPVVPADAEDIAKLMHRTYGYTYANEDVYFPDRIERAFTRNEKFGVIVRTESGRAVAYFAVLPLHDAATGEVAEVVVSPGHRRRGLMTRMLTALVEESGRRKIPALFGEAVTIHPITQRVNHKIGFQSMGLLLAHLPVTRYKGLAQEYPDGISAVVDYRLLEPIGRREVVLPDRYASLLTHLYAALGVEAVALESRPPAPAARTDLDVSIAYHNKSAAIVVRRSGRDVATRVIDNASSLRAKGVGTVFVDLPLDDPGIDGAVEALFARGYVFGSLMPLVHGDRDHLRMQQVPAAPDFDRIATWSELAAEIKERVRSEVEWSPRGRTAG